MSSSVNIIGAGGHARPVIQLLQHLGYSIGGVYDQSYDPSVEEQILEESMKGVFPLDSDERKLVLAIGSNDQRRKVFENHRKSILEDSIIHPTTLIEPSASIGLANIIFAKAYLSSMSEIGNNNIINAGAIIEHESTIGSHCHISVGAIICGRVTIGDNCFIGAGAVIRDKISITNHVTIGAGAVVVKDITDSGTYVGNPAKRLKE